MDPLTDPIHNTINMGAIVAPIASFFIFASPILACILTLMGICWYGVLFYDRFKKRRRINNDGM